MPQYGNAATILDFPDYYDANRAAVPKVLQGGISTGDWGARKPGTWSPFGGGGGRAAAQGENSLEAAGLNPPSNMQQSADMSQEVAEMWANLSAVYKGFREKGINLTGGIDANNPAAVEAHKIWTRLSGQYIARLNDVQRGKEFQMEYAKAAGDPNRMVSAIQDPSALYTASGLRTDVSSITPADIVEFNDAMQVAPKTEAEARIKQEQYNRFVSSFVAGRAANGDSQADIDAWVGQIKKPIPYTVDPMDAARLEEIKARTLLHEANAARARRLPVGRGGYGSGEKNNPVNLWLQSASSFLDDNNRKYASDQGRLNTLPSFAATDEWIRRDDPRLSQAMRQPVMVSLGDRENIEQIIYARTNDQSPRPVAYALIPEAREEGTAYNKKTTYGYRLIRINPMSTSNMNGKKVYTDVYTVSGRVKPVSQYDAGDFYGLGEADWIGAGDTGGAYIDDFYLQQ